MKPKDLKRPFTWEERKVLLEDHVLFVPEYYFEYESFSFPGWGAEEVFGNNQPVHVEYCSGNGLWILDRALAFPHLNWVAVEKRFDRVRKIWSKIKNHNLKNLFVVYGEAHCATKHYFPSESVAQAYLNFPDPWPKKRHEKHRIIHPEFVREVERVLHEQSTITLVTDHDSYSELMTESFLNERSFESDYPHPYYRTDVEDYGRSYFGDLWSRLGRTPRYMKFRKTAMKGAEALC
ncbi:MAG: tRNA (guanosine(46)-N7)-methyltransferase TrmB [Waddliaceae bacterium]|nr:tRNA (guanosine(46)-N7)-methyltransferase TrmB [Waddliaceae bacterium]